MPKGIYKHHSHQGFQKGNTVGFQKGQKCKNWNGWQKGHHPLSEFKKGRIAWNKDKKMSEKSKQKNREWHVDNPNKKFKNTGIEVKMQDELKKRNITFEIHKPLLKKFNVDIFIEPNVVIECDGDYYHTLPGRQERDRKRDIALKEAGYKIFRFWGYNINESTAKCVDQIGV
ncbi:MAG TPA: DUF559 domain-containing protein [bacterium]|nr:DUF559 domain-containing protein [bacterium]